MINSNVIIQTHQLTKQYGQALALVMWICPFPREASMAW